MSIFSFSIPVGKVATFTAATAATVARLQDAAGAGDPYTPVSVSAGGTLAIGPFSTVRRYQVDSDVNGSVAYTDADFATAADDALKLSKAADDTLADGVDIALGTTTGTKIGTATAQKLAFHNSTPVIQRAGAAQAAVADTGATNITPYGYTEAQANAIVSLVNELRAALVEKGIIKGAA